MPRNNSGQCKSCPDDAVIYLDGSNRPSAGRCQRCYERLVTASRFADEMAMFSYELGSGAKLCRRSGTYRRQGGTMKGTL